MGKACNSLPDWLDLGPVSVGLRTEILKIQCNVQVHQNINQINMW